MSVWYRRVTECTTRLAVGSGRTRRATRRVRSQIAGGKVFAEVAAVEILAGGLLDQLRGGEAAAMLPDILPQLVEQGAEIALRNIAV